MAIHFEDVNENVRRIKLSGRLDTLGSEEIDTRFASLAATARRGVVVELVEVSFLASMGIRALIANAKAQRNRGGRLVLFVGANDAVARTLEATGVDSLIPMFRNSADAEKAALTWVE